MLQCHVVEPRTGCCTLMCLNQYQMIHSNVVPPIWINLWKDFKSTKLVLFQTKVHLTFCKLPIITKFNKYHQTISDSISFNFNPKNYQLRLNHFKPRLTVVQIGQHVGGIGYSQFYCSISRLELNQGLNRAHGTGLFKNDLIWPNGRVWLWTELLFLTIKYTFVGFVQIESRFKIENNDGICG